MTDLTKHTGPILIALVAGLAQIDTAPAAAATLEVGPGKAFSRIEAAAAKAGPGDVILVHPLPDGAAYEKTAVFVRQPSLTFRAAPAKGAARVKISGKGFDYSGRGSTPRAIFQFNRGTDGCVLEGFELFGAHNDSHNGAGVRINQANRVTVRNCEIHHNDMGIMSNGDGSLQSGVAQRIEFCAIHHNGDATRPGYNHNLYLGGTSVTLSGCEVYSSLTGHNVKSRAHHTRVEYSYIHDSANREFDLVDAADTARPGSHAVLLGNVVVKDPQCPGNRNVLHFGQDGGGEHNGTVYLIHNTIVTPFITPVVNLSAPGAKAQLVGNIVCDGGVKQSNQQIAGARGGAKEQNVTGQYNWFSGGFNGVGDTRLQRDSNLFRRVPGPFFVAPAEHNYRLTGEIVQKMNPRRPAAKLDFPAVPGVRPAQSALPLAWQYRHPAGREKRAAEKTPMLGAHGTSNTR